jgi:hypothetical protein
MYKNKLKIYYSMNSKQKDFKMELKQQPEFKKESLFEIK